MPSPSSDTQPALASLAAEVLGDLAFMIADDEPQAPAPGTIWLQGEVGYRGPVCGSVQCWVTRSFAVSLAANLLGTDPNDAEAFTDAEDAVRELLNVLCGHLVTAWHGREAVFNLTIPQVSECLDSPQPPESSQSCSLCVDGEPVFLAHRPGA